VTDTTLASASDSFEWTFKENGDVARIDATPSGEIVYRPTTVGTLGLEVRILDTDGTEQAKVSIGQEVVLPSYELELLIAESEDKPGAGAGNPEVLRELVNEHSRYYQSLQLKTPEVGDGFQRFSFNIVMAGALRGTMQERKRQVDRLAAAINGGAVDFASLIAEGIGVSGIRLTLLAMILPQTSSPTPILPWSEFPDSPGQYGLADDERRRSLAALNEDTLIDLFNLVRFPKSNIKLCGRILESLRDHYFSGTNFNDVLTGMSGTRAHWITRHYLEGPLLRS
jgi:hypothetical protein